MELQMRMGQVQREQPPAGLMQQPQVNQQHHQYQQNSIQPPIMSHPYASNQALVANPFAENHDNQ